MKTKTSRTWKMETMGFDPNDQFHESSFLPSRSESMFVHVMDFSSLKRFS